MEVEHLPDPSQHISIDHIALVLAADRPPQTCGTTGQKTVPELTISFTSPNTHPKIATPGDPSQATVATAHTVTGTPYKPH